MTGQFKPRWNQETFLVAWLASCVSIVSFLYYLRHGDTLLYGDAIAHINIARRVFDSRTPGLLQLGTVWLPLPHLLMIPFLLSHAMWQSGVGGSIPSMTAYVFSVAGIFRLVRTVLHHGSKPDLSAKFSAWLAALIYAANPNLIYLQGTAMTEPLYLAFFIWAVVYFTGFVQHRIPRSLLKCGLCLAGACLTRYDGWFLTGIIALAVIFLRRGAKTSKIPLTKFLLLATAAPTLWILYNAVIYRNPLQFANGPYSAEAIDQRAVQQGAPPHPGTHNLAVAASYFVKAAELNMMGNNWHRLWLLVAFLGAIASLMLLRNIWPLWLLWAPLPFYVLSIAYGGIPVFVSSWWPFSLFNVRYGIELLPAFAVFSAVAVYSAVHLLQSRPAKTLLAIITLTLVGVSYASVWRSQPVCFTEAWVNSRSRLALEKELEHTLLEFPPNSTLLMSLSTHVGVLERAGIPLRRVIHEDNQRPWKQPFDPQGLWEKALAHPAQYANFVVTFAGDPVARNVNRRNLIPLVVLRASGQPECTVYSTQRSSQ